MSKDSDPFSCEEEAPPFNDHWVAKRRVSNAIKKITELLMTSLPRSEELKLIAERLERDALSLEASPRIYGQLDWAKTGDSASFGKISYELNPLIGLSNPLAPPVKCWILGDRAYGTCECNWTYEGPPNFVHGGVVASIFDQFLGMAQLLGSLKGMTAQLNTRYHKPTPLNTQLKMIAWLFSTEGRKTILHGEIYANGDLTASCEGIFVQPKGGLGPAQIHIRTACNVY